MFKEAPASGCASTGSAPASDASRASLVLVALTATPPPLSARPSSYPPRGSPRITRSAKVLVKARSPRWMLQV